MIAFIATQTFYVTITVLLVLIVLPVWAVADATSRPSETFVVTGVSKTTWIVLLIVLTLLTAFIGLGLSVNYLFFARRRMKAREPERLRRQGRFSMLIVSLFVLGEVAVLTPFALRSQSNLTNHPVAAIDGTLSGRCTQFGVPSHGIAVSVTLKTAATHRSVDTATLGGDTNSTDFQFVIETGTYVLRASWPTGSKRWTISFASNSTPRPVQSPTPVILTAIIHSVCS